MAQAIKKVLANHQLPSGTFELYGIRIYLLIYTYTYVII